MTTPHTPDGHAGPGRPPDPLRRAATLTRATDYVLEHGLNGLSLRPLAAALGTSTRMLLYDFGSKEKLIVAVLAEARRRESALLDAQRRSSTGTARTVQAVWEWMTADARAPFMRLFFEVYVDALRHPDRYPRGAQPFVEDWFTLPGADLDTTTTTLLIAVLRGLLLDRLATGDRRRTDDALARLVNLVTAD